MDRLSNRYENLKAYPHLAEMQQKNSTIINAGNQAYEAYQKEQRRSWLKANFPDIFCNEKGSSLEDSLYVNNKRLTAAIQADIEQRYAKNRWMRWKLQAMYGVPPWYETLLYGLLSIPCLGIMLSGVGAILGGTLLTNFAATSLAFTLFASVGLNPFVLAGIVIGVATLLAVICLWRAFSPATFWRLMPGKPEVIKVNETNHGESFTKTTSSLEASDNSKEITTKQTSPEKSDLNAEGENVTDEDYNFEALIEVHTPGEEGFLSETSTLTEEQRRERERFNRNQKLWQDMTPEQRQKHKINARKQFIEKQLKKTDAEIERLAPEVRSRCFSYVNYILQDFTKTLNEGRELNEKESEKMLDILDKATTLIKRFKPIPPPREPIELSSEAPVITSIPPPPVKQPTVKQNPVFNPSVISQVQLKPVNNPVEETKEPELTKQLEAVFDKFSAKHNLSEKDPSDISTTMTDSWMETDEDKRKRERQEELERRQILERQENARAEAEARRAAVSLNATVKSLQEQLIPSETGTSSNQTGNINHNNDLFARLAKLRIALTDSVILEKNNTDSDLGNEENKQRNDQSLKMQKS